MKKQYPIRRILLYILFALSGAAGLMYELVWVRQLSFILGSSAFAVTIILASYMCGLGLGAWLIGKAADRLANRRLVFLYVILELIIGAFALLVPLFLHIQKSVYVGLHQTLSLSGFSSFGIRFILAFLLFVLPTTLMGGTLPVLSKYLNREKHTIGITVSSLYAVNTFGAFLGIIATGFILLPAIGNYFTNFTAVGINVFIAVVFFSFTALKKGGFSDADSRETPPPEIADRKKAEQKTVRRLRSLQPLPGHTDWLILLVFALSGFTGMSYEVAWTRTLSMVVGTTHYAFTTMLAAFIFGIAVGSYLYHAARRIAGPLQLIIVLQLIIAFFVLLSMPLFERLPFIYLSLFERLPTGWQNLQILRFIIAFGLMIIPTAALGAMFPAVSDYLSPKRQKVSSKIGRAYGLNTFGGVLGSVITSLVLIPLIGLQKAILTGAVINLASSLILLIVSSRAAIFYKLIVPSLLAFSFLLLTAFLNPWSPKILSSGVYVYADRYLAAEERIEEAERRNIIERDPDPWEVWENIMRQYRVLYFNTGPAATVSVMETEDRTRFLTIDGKTDASTQKTHDMKTQVLLGQLPLLFSETVKDIFIVGLGSGVTAGAVLTHPVDQLTCAEISPAVVEASAYFSHVNHNIFQHAEFEIVARDARNIFLTDDSKFDVIISQPSNPWIDGQSSLFTREWYQLVHSRLREGGIFAQWIPAYQMSQKDVKIIMKTLKAEFPYLTAWTSGSIGDLIFLAKKNGPLRFSYDVYLEKIESDMIYNDIKRLDFNPEALPFDTFVMNNKQIHDYITSHNGSEIQINSDSFLVTEYSTPKKILKKGAVSRFATPAKLSGKLEKLAPIISDLSEAAVIEMGEK